MRTLMILLACLLLICRFAHGHPGRLDSNGGHHDRKNGGYHYHNRSQASIQAEARAIAERRAKNEALERARARAIEEAEYYRQLKSQRLLTLAPNQPDGVPKVTAEAIRNGRSIEGVITTVVDGDTFRIKTADGDHEMIRLAAVDAPEMNQPFGVKARGALRKIVGKKIRGRAIGNDHGRVVAVVKLEGDKLTIQHRLVRAGFAWHATEQSNSGRLAAAESKARTARKGLWANPDAIAPWIWRRGVRKTVTQLDEEISRFEAKKAAESEEESFKAAASNYGSLDWLNPEEEIRTKKLYQAFRDEGFSPESISVLNSRTGDWHGLCHFDATSWFAKSDEEKESLIIKFEEIIGGDIRMFDSEGGGGDLTTKSLLAAFGWSETTYRSERVK